MLNRLVGLGRRGIRLSASGHPRPLGPTLDVRNAAVDRRRDGRLSCRASSTRRGTILRSASSRFRRAREGLRVSFIPTHLLKGFHRYPPMWRFVARLDLHADADVPHEIRSRLGQICPREGQGTPSLAPPTPAPFPPTRRTRIKATVIIAAAVLLFSSYRPEQNLQAERGHFTRHRSPVGEPRLADRQPRGAWFQRVDNHFRFGGSGSARRHGAGGLHVCDCHRARWRGRGDGRICHRLLRLLPDHTWNSGGPATADVATTA